MNTIKHIWHFLGSIHVTIFIFALMMADLLWAYTCLSSHPEIFYPINDLGYIKWMHTYGLSAPFQTAWLFILIGLGTLLSINTFICTTERVYSLIKNRSAFSRLSRFVYQLSPHIMHYAMLVILLGYLVSYLEAETRLGNILIPGRDIQIPGSSVTIYLDQLDIDYYKGDRLLYMSDRAIQVAARLTVKNGNKEKSDTLSYNQPVFFYPYSIHLKDFAPKSEGGMGRKKYINIIIKKDPGMIFYFGGILLFTAGLFIYLFQKLPWVIKKGGALNEI